MKVSEFLKPKGVKNLLTGDSKMAGFRNKLFKASTVLNKDVLSNMKTRMIADDHCGLKNREIINIVGEETPEEEEVDSDGNVIESPVKK